MLGKDVLIGCPQKKACDFEDVALEKVAIGIMTIQGQLFIFIYIKSWKKLNFLLTDLSGNGTIDHAERHFSPY